MASPHQGLIYIFTGEGKGKTSAALGVAIRAYASGMSIGWIAWYKQASWGISEFELTKTLDTSRWHMHALGAGFHIDNPSEVKATGAKQIKVAKISGDSSVIDTASDSEHEQAAQAALIKASELIAKVDVLVLDEINNAIHDHLLKVQEVNNLLQQRRNTHCILTGRDAHPKLVHTADLVTSMEKIKHPYDSGHLAVKGLDF